MVGIKSLGFVLCIRLAYFGERLTYLLGRWRFIGINKEKFMRLHINEFHLRYLYC